MVHVVFIHCYLFKHSDIRVEKTGRSLLAHLKCHNGICPLILD